VEEGKRDRGGGGMRGGGGGGGTEHWGRGREVGGRGEGDEEVDRIGEKKREGGRGDRKGAEEVKVMVRKG